MSRSERDKGVDWAADRPVAGEEPLFARFDYVKLRETLEEIVSVMEAATQMDGLPQGEPQPDSDVQIVVPNTESDWLDARFRSAKLISG
jgi:hypothetical protein